MIVLYEEHAALIRKAVHIALTLKAPVDILKYIFLLISLKIRLDISSESSAT